MYLLDAAKLLPRLSVDAGAAEKLTSFSGVGTLAPFMSFN